MGGKVPKDSGGVRLPLHMGGAQHSGHNGLLMLCGRLLLPLIAVAPG